MKKMCLSLFEFLFKKFVLLVLLIYEIPAFAVLGYAMSAGSSAGKYSGLTTDYSPMFESWLAVVALLLLFIPGPLILCMEYPLIMVPYFTISYGLLYLYWRRCKHAQSPKGETLSA
jgi:hypothetical protein